MTVYVLEIGEYDSCEIAGVYESPEAAMKAHQKGEWALVAGGAYWDNGLHWEDAGQITAYEIQS